MYKDIQVTRRQNGFGLMDVIAAILILAVGVLAFSQLISSLARSGLDAQLRTMASNIVEESIETQRRFTRLESDPDGDQFAYNDIGNSTNNVSMSDVNFTIIQTVSDYYWDSATHQFTTTAPSGRVYSDFKEVALLVSWENPLEFRISDGQLTSGHLGSGQVSLNSIISSEVSAKDRLSLLNDLSVQSFEPAGSLGGVLPEL